MILSFPRAGLFNFFVSAFVTWVLALALVFLVLFGFAAHAQTVIGAPPPVPSGIGSILLGIITPANVGVGLGGVLAILGGFQFFTAKRKTAVALAAYYAFHVTEDVYEQLDDGPVKDGFNKAANALKVADDYLKKSGWRGLKPGESDVVAIQLQAIHGGEVAKEKLVVAQAAAVAAQADAPAVPKPA